MSEEITQDEGEIIHGEEELEEEEDDNENRVSQSFVIDKPEEDGRISGLGDYKYIDIDWPQVNENGEEVIMRITVPVIREKKKREFKKITRKRIVEIPYDSPEEEAEGDELFAKEDIIEYYEATVVLETVTKTVLIKTKNSEGEIVEIEKDVVEEFIISDDPSKFKVIAVKKVLSDGEEILEEHITPELSVKEPYEETVESAEEFLDEEGVEEEFSTSDELRALAELEEAETEEEEEDEEISFAELEEEDAFSSDLAKGIRLAEDIAEEDDIGEYIEEGANEDEKYNQDEDYEESDGQIETEEEEDNDEYNMEDEIEEEEFIIAEFPKDYGYKADDEEISVSEESHKKIDKDSTIESEEKSIEEETEEEVLGKKEKTISKISEKRSKASVESIEEEETFQELKEDIIETEEIPKKQEPAIEINKYWWRTSGYDIEEFDLPDDPVKANRILLAELWEQLKLHDRYCKEIENYYRKNKDEISYFPPYLEADELQKYYSNELKELKQILDTFSDSYDDFNYKMTLVRKKNKKNDKLLDFFMEALKKTLTDLAKRTDRKALIRYTKGKTLEQMISCIFQLEDKLNFAYIRKAIYSLEIEEMKYMIVGGEKDQNIVPLEDRAVDLLLLAEMQSKCHHSADLLGVQEFKIKKLKEAFGIALDDYCFKLHESSYNDLLKELNLKRLDNQLKEININRSNHLKNLLNSAEFRKKEAKRLITEEKLRKIHRYLSKK